jgi:hypothetical protein
MRTLPSSHERLTSPGDAADTHSTTVVNLIGAGTRPPLSLNVPGGQGYDSR